MGRGLWVAAALCALGSLSHAGGDSQPIPLRDAVSKKLVSAAARGTGSWRLVDLDVRNASDSTLRLDIAGTMLEPPERFACVRLGLGPVSAGGASPTGPVEVGPGASIALTVMACPIDSGMPVPAKGAPLVVSAEAPPAP